MTSRNSHVGLGLSHCAKVCKFSFCNNCLVGGLHVNKTMKRMKTTTTESEDDDENIWELKPKRWSMKIVVKKRSGGEGHSQLKTKTARKKKVCLKTKATSKSEDGTAASSGKNSPHANNIASAIPQSSGNCPSCQMPLVILRLESPRSHVTECMDLPIKASIG